MCPACYQRNRIDSQTIITHDCLHLDSYNILRKASLVGDRNETLEQLFQSITSTSPLKSEIPTVFNYQQFIDRYVSCIIKLNLSFSGSTSTEVKQLMNLYAELIATSPLIDLDSLFLPVNYRQLSLQIHDSAMMKANHLKEDLVGRTVTLMMDGGQIGTKNVVASTIVIHEDGSKPHFWSLEQGCSDSVDYSQLTHRIIEDIEAAGGRVISICADGLRSQRKAFSLIKATPDHPFVPFYIWCGNHRTNLALGDIFEHSKLLKDVRDSVIRFASESRKRKVRDGLGLLCPTYNSTRWFCLNQICEFIRRNRAAIPENLLSLLEITNALQLEILLYPFYELHLTLEKNTAKLMHLYPAVMRALNLFFLLSKFEVFETEWLHGIRVAITCLYERFLKGDQGKRCALAFALTPDGLKLLQNGRFSQLSAYAYWTIENVGAPVGDLKKMPAEGIPQEYQAEKKASSSSSGVSSSSSSALPASPSDLGYCVDPLSVQAVDSLVQSFLTTDCSKSVKQKQVEQKESTEELLEKTNCCPHLKKLLLLLVPHDDTNDKQSAVPSQDAQEHESAYKEDKIPMMDVANQRGNTSGDEEDPIIDLLDNSFQAQDTDYFLGDSEEVAETPTSQQKREESTSASSKTSESSSSAPESPAEDDVIYIASSKVLDIPPMTTATQEHIYLLDLYGLIQSDLIIPISATWDSYVKSLLPNLPLERQTLLHSQFTSLIANSNPFSEVRNPFRFLRILALSNQSLTLFCYLARCLLASSVSESSCERIFSRAKWIIGQRRHRLSVQTLNALLHILEYSPE